MANNSITNDKKILLGCKAFAGISVTRLAEEYETNRKYVYTQKGKVKEVLGTYFEVSQNDLPVIVVDKAIIEKTVLACMVICKGSTEDCQEFLKEVYNLDISTGSISNIIKSAAEKAKAFNESIPLSNIKAGANDEIFQCGKPILVGVDVYSTYIYLMQASESRDGDGD